MCNTAWEKRRKRKPCSLENKSKSIVISPRIEALLLIERTWFNGKQSNLCFQSDYQAVHEKLHALTTYFTL